MVNELRNYGDGKTITLYTNQDSVYKSLKDSKKVIKVVPYELEQNGRSVMVGCDLYFDKKYRSWFDRKLAGLDTD